MKMILIRIATLIAVLVISIALFYSGKGHTLLLDNKTIEINSSEYKALDFVDVKIDSGEFSELLKRDRTKELVAGQKHKITVNYMDMGVEKEIQKTFKLKVGDPMYLLSIPALIAEDDDWLQVFELLN